VSVTDLSPSSSHITALSVACYELIIDKRSFTSKTKIQIRWKLGKLKSIGIREWQFGFSLDRIGILNRMTLEMDFQPTLSRVQPESRSGRNLSKSKVIFDTKPNQFQLKLILKLNITVVKLLDLFLTPLFPKQTAKENKQRVPTSQRAHWNNWFQNQLKVMNVMHYHKLRFSSNRGY